MPRVLIAEDDDLIAKLLRTLAERNGCDTAVAADGAEALALLQRSQFDLVLLDLMMPVMNGYELIPHIRKMPNRPAVLVVTAMMGERFLELDADVVTAIIHKPFDTEFFASVIAQVAGAMSDQRQIARPAPHPAFGHPLPASRL
jgi:CheY-like chemotaxis protein